jgi:hypothetical protein
MEEASTSETSVNFYQTTRRNIPEGSHLHPQVMFPSEVMYIFIWHSLYSSPNIIRVIKSRRMGWAGHEARMEEIRKAYKMLVGNPEGKRPLGRPTRRWENNIKIYLQGSRSCGHALIHLAKGRTRWRALVNTVMNVRVP